MTIAVLSLPTHRTIKYHGIGAQKSSMENGGTLSGQVRARHIPAARWKTRFSQAWQPSRCICRFYDKRKVRPVPERSPFANRPPSPAYLRHKATDSIERTAYASRSRNNWELPVIPSTDPIGIGEGAGAKKEKKRSWLNRD